MQNQNQNRLRAAQQIMRRAGLNQKNPADYTLLKLAAVENLTIEGSLKTIVEKLERVLEVHEKRGGGYNIKTRVKL